MTGNASFSSAVTVSGVTTLNGVVNVNAAVNLFSTLSLSSSLEMGGALEVAGAAVFNGLVGAYGLVTANDGLKVLGKPLTLPIFTLSQLASFPAGDYPNATCVVSNSSVTAYGATLSTTPGTDRVKVWSNGDVWKIG